MESGLRKPNRLKYVLQASTSVALTWCVLGVILSLSPAGVSMGKTTISPPAPEIRGPESGAPWIGPGNTGAGPHQRGGYSAEAVRIGQVQTTTGSTQFA